MQAYLPIIYLIWPIILSLPLVYLVYISASMQASTRILTVQIVLFVFLVLINMLNLSSPFAYLWVHMTKNSNQVLSNH